jgi:murein DD-endopeptidase MepM/ murein hydrolase activator NlpD
MGSYRTINSAFRDPDHPFTPGKHSGTDIDAPVGIPVLAPAAGVVDGIRAVGPCEDASVRVQFGEDWVYAVHHLSRVDVKDGQVVVRGQRLGLSGGEVGALGSGKWTTGPHLHLSMVHERSYVNAINYLCP